MAAFYQNLAAFVVCCFVLLQSGTDAVYSMHDTCKVYTEGYIADPGDCSAWGYCRGGKVIATGKCGTGLLYNSFTGGCDYPQNVNCNTNKTTMCNGLNAVFKADPDSSDCTSYCYCTNSKLEGCTKCPNNQVYDPASTTCVYKKDYPCPRDSPCLLVQNNKFVADLSPNNCGGWIRCVNGATASSGRCSNGMVYDPQNGYCSSTASLDCDGSSQPENTGLSQAQILNICNSGYTGTAEVYVDDQHFCGGYVACKSKTQGSWHKCPFGTHFNPTAQKCVTPFTYVCPYDRCDNMDLQYVTTKDTGCGGYTVCQNQKSTGATGSCTSVNSEYQFFNEEQGGCVLLKPSQEICGTSS